MKNLTLSPTGKLFVSAQSGNQVALSDLMTRIEKRLYRFCYFLTGNKESAQDLAQEAYMKAIENLHTLNNPKSFVSWLFKLTKNHFLDYVRSSHHKRAVLVEKIDGDLFARGQMDELRMQIIDSLSELSAEDRYLVLLVCMEGHSYEQGAKLLGISEEAVRCKLYRLRKLIKSQIYTRDLP